jgi:hypothetical protein
VETGAVWLASLTAGSVAYQVVAVLRGARPIQRYDTLDARKVYELFIAPLYILYMSYFPIRSLASNLRRRPFAQNGAPVA